MTEVSQPRDLVTVHAATSASKLLSSGVINRNTTTSAGSESRECVLFRIDLIRNSTQTSGAEVHEGAVGSC